MGHILISTPVQAVYTHTYPAYYTIQYYCYERVCGYLYNILYICVQYKRAEEMTAERKRSDETTPVLTDALALYIYAHIHRRIIRIRYTSRIRCSNVLL